MQGERGLWRAIIKNRAFKVSHYSSSFHSSISQQFGKLKHHLGFDLPDVWPSTTSSSQHPSNPHLYRRNYKVTNSCWEILRMKDAFGKIPGLAFVLVGQGNDSHSLVRTKMKACDKVGISSTVVELGADCSEDEALHVVSNLNEDPSVHGVNVQLPLPEHMDEEMVLNVVNPEKDVDGFHPLNMGCRATKGRKPFYFPCAAISCIDLFLRSGIEIVGKNAVVIGRGKIVGLPVSLLLQRHHSTVSVVHPFTKNPQDLTRDIIITDVGVPNMVRGDWLKQGAVVLDAGTNAVKDPDKKHGFCITGDLCFEEAIRVASVITRPWRIGTCNNLHAALQYSQFC